MTLLSHAPAIIYFFFIRHWPTVALIPATNATSAIATLTVAERSVARSRLRQTLKIESPLLMVDEIARFLRIHPTTIYRLIKSKKIPAFRVGSEWRFDRKEIDRWIEMQQNRAPDAARKR